MSNDQHKNQQQDKLWPEYVRVVEKNYSIDDAVMDRMCVELIEDEIDRELEKEIDDELKTWLTEADGGAEEMARLSGLRRILKKSDDVPMPESGAYYDALESRILSALDECIDCGEVAEHGVVHTSIEERVAFSKRALTREALGRALPPLRRSTYLRAGQFALLAGFVLLSTGKWLTGLSGSNQSGSEATKALQATRKAAPEVLTSTVMSFESDADLALEIAARRLVAYHKGE